MFEHCPSMVSQIGHPFLIYPTSFRFDIPVKRFVPFLYFPVSFLVILYSFKYEMEAVRELDDVVPSWSSLAFASILNHSSSMAWSTLWGKGRSSAIFPYSVRGFSCACDVVNESRFTRTRLRGPECGRFLPQLYRSTHHTQWMTK